MHIESLYRYPIKGLTPETLASAPLTPGRCIPWDRAFALKQGDAALDETHPAWISKMNFMCLAKNPKAALLKTRFDDATGLLHIAGPAGSLTASPFTPEGQAALTVYFTTFLGEEARYGTQGEPPKFHFFPGHSFCDHKTQVVSLIGLSSLATLEQAVGATRDKRRFRANVYIEDSEPWEEFSWLGRKLAIGEVEMVVQERIDRCAATMVNPDTAERDANPVKELRSHFGHIELGIFAEITKGGTLRAGDPIRLI
ncbi:MOSC domain-containing protein [Acidocella sp.]|uniref:MOSC domain-containing protein n=1 Tax=Acidocella sp. TaxID=50710 RepID=UPI003D0902EB